MAANGEAPHTLLSLPAEVKQNMLSYLLCAEKPIDIFNDMHGLIVRHSAIYIPVLYTCHDLYERGRLVLYQRNHLFSDHRPPCFGAYKINWLKWLEKLSSHDVAYLSSVECKCYAVETGIKKTVEFHELRARLANLVQRYVENLAVLRVPKTVNTGLHHLHTTLDYLNEPVHLATFMRALTMLPQLNALKIALKAIPMVWLLYLNQRLRIPVSYRSKLFRWDPVKMFRRLEHRMRLSKQFEVRPVDKLPPRLGRLSRLSGNCRPYVYRPRLASTFS
ncbi:hypothetical protein B5807_11351 [Epicoccum nigrum]|uniref:F-box domain-containing protein n=1 Tax=Epicoccum nigrum TaxID=105696 RepID=A0A1Y2LJM3_EPING|nr:hypothetical protein B5807_11351 [Epicoccum nigrum]